MEKLTRDEQIKVLRERFRTLFSSQEHPILEDDEKWEGTDSLPPDIRYQIDDAEANLRSRIGERIEYIDIEIAYMLAMFDLGRLRMNGKGHWKYSPLLVVRPRDD